MASESTRMTNVGLHLSGAIVHEFDTKMEIGFYSLVVSIFFIFFCNDQYQLLL